MKANKDISCKESEKVVNGPPTRGPDRCVATEVPRDSFTQVGESTANILRLLHAT